MCARGTAVKSVELKVITHTKSYWRSNTGVALDGAAHTNNQSINQSELGLLSIRNSLNRYLTP